MNITHSERSQFTFDDAGMLDLKGSPEQVQAWHVRWGRDAGRLSAEQGRSVKTYCDAIIGHNEIINFSGLLQVKEILRLRIEDLYVPLSALPKAAERRLSHEELRAHFDQDPERFREMR